MDEPIYMNTEPRLFRPHPSYASTNRFDIQRVIRVECLQQLMDKLYHDSITWIIPFEAMAILNLVQFPVNVVSECTW